MKCLEILDETKLLTDSDICFGYNSIRTWGKFFKMTLGMLENVFMLVVLLIFPNVLFNNAGRC
jgi:hypothetical protein